MYVILTLITAVRMYLDVLYVYLFMYLDVLYVVYLLCILTYFMFTCYVSRRTLCLPVDQNELFACFKSSVWFDVVD